MAKKDKKKNQDQRDPSPADAIRSAVEQAFAATTGGATSTAGRAQDIVEEITSAANRVRGALDDLRLFDDLKGLRAEVESLTSRVVALEARPQPSAQQPAAKGRKATATAGTKPAGTRSRSTAASRPRAPRATRPAPPGDSGGDPAPESSTGRS